MAAYIVEDANKLPRQVEQKVMTIVNAMSQIAHSHNIVLEYGQIFRGELKAIVRTQILTPEFCVNYILSGDFIVLDSDSNIDAFYMCRRWCNMRMRINRRWRCTGGSYQLI